MGRFKTEADRANKRMLKDRVAQLEHTVKLLNAVTANLVREVAASNQLKTLMAQPEAQIVPTEQPRGEAAATETA